MDNYFSKVLVIILTSIMLCVIPAFYINMITDYAKLDNRINSSRKILDKITYSGHVINDDINFLLENKGDIVIFRDVFLPGELSSRKVAFTDYTIKKYLEDNNKFYLEQGDEVCITFINNEGNVSLFMERLFGIKLNSNYIRTCGVVKNESY